MRFFVGNIRTKFNFRQRNLLHFFILSLENLNYIKDNTILYLKNFREFHISSPFVLPHISLYINFELNYFLPFLKDIVLALIITFFI